jgi:hypothetical protein
MRGIGLLESSSGASSLFFSSERVDSDNLGFFWIIQTTYLI